MKVLYLLPAIVALFLCYAQEDDVPAYIYINEYRRDAAIQYQIANMFKLEQNLEWQERFDKLALSAPEQICLHAMIRYDSGYQKTGSSRWLMFPAHAGYIEELLGNERNSDKVRDSIKTLKKMKETVEAVEYLLPIQEWIACKEVKCTRSHWEEHPLSFLPWIEDKKITDEYDKMCLVGPSSDIEYMIYEHISNGPPGSDCERYGRVNEDGLCALPPPTTEPPQETPKLTKNEDQLNSSGGNYAMLAPMMLAVMKMF